MTNAPAPAAARFSANLSMLFTELDPLQRIGAAAGAGFDAVEWQFPYDLDMRELKARCDEHGVAFNHINTPAGGGKTSGLAAQPGREDEFFRALDLTLDYARHLGCLTVHCMPGVVAQEDRARARNTFLRNMEKAAEMAASASVLLCIEPINSRDRPDFFVSRSDEIAQLLVQIGHPHVRMLFDFYHIQIMEGDLFKRLERHWEWIGHIQIASVPSRHEPDRGELDLGNVCAEIMRRGWRGYIGAEYNPAGRTQDGLGWLRAAKAVRA
ncbi:MAG: TIM barrel protein [Alphaproteobacteria bacterium]|nr:TIM barrel protein [Alphaproteobacteria bacterium]